MTRRSGELVAGTTDSFSDSVGQNFRPHPGEASTGTTDTFSEGVGQNFRPHSGSVENLCAGEVTFYLMSWEDVDASSVTYRTWKVASAPDLTGAMYTGPKSGATPISNPYIACVWTVTG
jgi:hypothetical protein